MTALSDEIERWFQARPKWLRAAGDHLGIGLFDHIIFNAGRHYSFLEHREDSLVEVSPK